MSLTDRYGEDALREWLDEATADDLILLVRESRSRLVRIIVDLTDEGEVEGAARLARVCSKEFGETLLW